VIPPEAQSAACDGRALSVHSLAELAGSGPDYHAVSPVAWAVLEGLYSRRLIDGLLDAAHRLASQADSRFLDLKMLRGAHRLIPELREIMFDRARLDLLSEVAQTPLEPYPIDIAACHINYYESGRRPLAFHSDGAAMVELVPLDDGGDSCAATLVFNGPRDDGLELFEMSSSNDLPDSRLLRIPHRVGQSILLQGRRLVHSGATTDRDRVLLVFALRATDEPWKDDNTIARLAMDYEPADFLDSWIEDEITRKLPALRNAQADHG
jgi:hypothetical protein